MENDIRERMAREKWFALPLKLRVRWWIETDYGRNEPSPELKQEIENYGKQEGIRSGQSSPQEGPR